MSFLTRTAVRGSSRAAFAPRAFSTTFVVRKGPVEVAKDTLKAVDRKVSDTLVAGIDTGEVAAKKVKEVSGMSSGEVKGKAAELTGEAKGKAAELKGEANAKANELKGEAKGKL